MSRKSISDHLNQQFAKTRFAETNKSTIQDKKNPGIEESKNSLKEESNNLTIQEKKKPRIQESKNSRDVDSQKRIAVNLMVREDYDRAIKIIAAQRRVRPCVILEEALRKYLRSVKIQLCPQEKEMP